MKTIFKKRNFVAMAATALVLIFRVATSCKTNDPNLNLATTPEALAVNNSSSAGVYKGIIVGSSGYFNLSIMNGSNEATCKFVFDGNETTLTSASFGSWTSGQSLNNALFTGTLDGKTINLTFSCNADGSNPITTVTIPGHTVYTTVVKEKSDMLVKCYEGTYTVAKKSGKINGTWNFVAYKLASGNGSLVAGYRADPESNGAIYGDEVDGVLQIGEGPLKMDETSVSGSFKNGDGEVVTVTGKRTY